MDTYSLLVSEVLKHEILSNFVSTMVHDYPEDINLITPHWESKLENSHIYQDYLYDPKSIFQVKFKTDYLTFEVLRREKQDFNILLVDVCRFVKPFKGKANKFTSIMLNDSLPMNKIVDVMTRDLDKSCSVSKECKFHFIPCSVLCCNACMKAAKLFDQAGYKFNKDNDPCIKDTQIFDGYEIFNRFTSHMADAFPQTFIAIMRIKVDTRYNYPDANNVVQYRVGGKVLEMMAFHESKLVPMKEIYIGQIYKTNEITDGKKHSDNDFLNETMEDSFEPGNSGFGNFLLENPSNKRPMEDAEEVMEALPNACKKQSLENSGIGNIFLDNSSNKRLINDSEEVPEAFPNAQCLDDIFKEELSESLI